MTISQHVRSNKNLSDLDLDRLVTANIFSMTEEKCGMIFACGPTIRQFFAYWRRVGTILPSHKRQKPEEDFVRMRRRVELRDLFWFRQPVMRDGRVIEVHPLFHGDKESPQIAQAVEATAHVSVFDAWRVKTKNALTRIFIR